MDGRVFVKRALRSGQKYDLVMLDAYEHEYIPEHLLTIPHTAVVTPAMTRRLHRIDARSLKAGLVGHRWR